VLTDRKPFKEISILLKETYPKYPVKLVFKQRIVPKFPLGITEGHEVQALFSKIAWQSNLYTNFDEFPIPFRCVASDIISGKPFVFRYGDLATAMRASMSVPALFRVH
jgi:NTE family protein